MGIQTIVRAFARAATTSLIALIIMIQFCGCTTPKPIQEKFVSGKKNVPLITFQNLSPPYEDYKYLQGIEKYKFEFNATAFSLVNAWWLAEISTLSYSKENFVGPRLKKAGFTDIVFFDKQSTQCYVASNDQFAVIAFRGSEIWKRKDKLDLKKVMADLKADVDIRLVDWPPGGKVHRGFKQALDEVWPELLPCIRNLERKGCKVWITGHSLGGALAILCGGLLGTAQGVYAFGSPKVGNEAFKEHLHAKVYRIVNNNDIVSRSPSFFVYLHAGEPRYIDDDGIIGDSAPEKERQIYPPYDDIYGHTTTTGPSKNDSSRGFVPSSIRDHVPLIYTVHLWNNLVESRKYP